MRSFATHFRALTLLPFLLVLLLVSCDTREDSRLLNPAMPDSTRFRVVNLTGTEAVDVWVNGALLASNVAPLQTSDYRNILFVERATIVVTRAGRSDTLSEFLKAGTRVTLFVLGKSARTDLQLRAASAIEESDLLATNLGRLTFINGLSDPGGALVRRGCQSGDTIFPRTPYAGSFLRELPGADIPIYLFAGSPLILRRSGNVRITPGRITWLVASRSGDVDRLYAISPADRQLVELPEETRTEASVQVLNAASDGVPITAKIGSAGTSLAADLAPLELSSSVSVAACSSVNGDSIEITPAGGSAVLAPVRMEVGSRTVAVVYGLPGAYKALTLRIDPPVGLPETAYLRVVHVSSALPAAQLMFGDGAPVPLTQQSLAVRNTVTGEIGGFQPMRPGAYPLILQEPGTGKYLAGGIEDLTPGYHTLLIVDRDGAPDLMMLHQADAPGVVAPIANIGSRARLFNLMTDALASFSAGAMKNDSVAYSYVRTTVVPFTSSEVATNVGAVSVDHQTRKMIVGTTGSGGAHRVVSISSPALTPANGNVSVRMLNLAPDGRTLTVVVAARDTLLAAADQVSFALEVREGKYSFTIVDPADGSVVGQVSGVELGSGRLYLLVIGPRLDGSSTNERYRTMLIQE